MADYTPPGTYAFTVPVKATSSLNARLHWRARAAVVRRERLATFAAFRNALPLWVARDKGRESYLVTLTRTGPRRLDDDNVQGALKAIRDEVAKQLGLDDGDPRITWVYRQAKGKYGVHVSIEAMEAAA